MYCPKFNSMNTRVTHTIHKNDAHGGYIIRYRQCIRCGWLFRTREDCDVSSPTAK